jgi:hypothetical protein
MDNAKVEVYQLPAMGGNDALNGISIVGDVLVPWCVVVGEHEKRVMVTHSPQSPPCEETLVVWVK